VAAGVVGQLQRDALPGAVDAAGVLARARTRCVALPFALAVAQLTLRHGLADAAARYRYAGLDIVGEPDGTYRLDSPKLLARSLGVHTRAGRRVLRMVRALAFDQPSGMWWSPDPTRRELDPLVQSRIAYQLAVAKDAYAGATIAVMDHNTAFASMAKLPLLDAVAAGTSLEVAAHKLRTIKALRAAAHVAAPLSARVVAADAGGWGRVDGAWATLSQQRSLASESTRLAAMRPVAPLPTVAAHLTAELHAVPTISFTQLPPSAFYPWPVDGVLDTASVAATVDKPATLWLRIYDPVSGAIIRTVQQNALPGMSLLTWDGRSDAGRLEPPGAYRYDILAQDLAANRSLAPGPMAFTLAQDTTPPIVLLAHVKLIRSQERWRTVRVRWLVTEPLSPVMRIRVQVRGPRGIVRAVILTSHHVTGSELIRLHLRRGTWTSSITFTDGSRNAATAASDSLHLA
jgi:hypothetical protein